MSSSIAGDVKRAHALLGLRGIDHVPPLVITAAPGLLALGICLYQLSLPHAFLGVHGADDGVYLGAALRLADGVLPYRDFTFVHPPGIALLMAPIGILGRIAHTRDAMAAARVVTAVAAAMNASLAAFAVRSLGRGAMLLAGLALAVFPSAVSANHTLTLDPYLVLFCLLGVVTMFSAGELATPRRILLAGALFGFAGAVKVWAVFPVIAALCVCAPRWRSAVRPFVSGLVLGFGIPSLPFFLVAPGSFFHDVVIAQLHRADTGQGFRSVDQRLVLMLGLGHPSGVPAKAHLAALLASAFVAVIVVVYGVGRRSRFEWFALGASAVSFGAMLLLVKEFYEYYSYFTAAFGVLLLGVCFSRIADGLRRAYGRISGPPERALAVASAGFLALFVVAGALLVRSDASYARSFLSSAYDPQATIAPQIPKGACVVFDEAGNPIDSNRFFPSGHGCPQLVDAFGLWLTDNDGIAPPAAQLPYSKAFVARWRSWLERADYAVLVVPQSNYLPWTRELVLWFNRNYRLVASQPSANVYRNLAPR